MRKKSWLFIPFLIAIAVAWYFFGNETNPSKRESVTKALKKSHKVELGNVNNSERLRVNTVAKPLDGVPNVSTAGSTETPVAKLLKKDSNGIRVYQVGDTQITVAPDGELFFLPKNI